MAKKHTKPNPNAGIEGGIIEKEMPIEISIVFEFSSKVGLIASIF